MDKLNPLPEPDYHKDRVVFFRGSICDTLKVIGKKVVLFFQQSDWQYRNKCVWGFGKVTAIQQKFIFP